MVCRIQNAAVGFMGLEALTWTAYISWRGKGNDIKAEFRTYADRHWHEARYSAWRDWNKSQADPYRETHALPNKDTDTQQYYELIGKYHQFVYGWDDIKPNFTTDNMSVQSRAGRLMKPVATTATNTSNAHRSSLAWPCSTTLPAPYTASVYTRTLQKQTEPRLWIDIRPVDIEGRTMVALRTRF